MHLKTSEDAAQAILDGLGAARVNSSLNKLRADHDDRLSIFFYCIYPSQLFLGSHHCREIDHFELGQFLS